MKVRKRVYASGREAWQLDLGEIGGRRLQRSFETREAALAAMRDARASRDAHGRSVALLSAPEMAEIVSARERLEEAGATLREAVDFFFLHATAIKERVLMPELVTRFIASRRAEDCSERYARQLKVSLGSLAQTLATRSAHEVLRADVEAWLRGNGWKPKTRNNYLGDARSLFAWAMTAGHVSRSPCEGIAKARLGDEEIGTLTLRQCERLLRAALAKPEFMGPLVLGMFGGLRPAEIGRLTWSAVDLKAGTVVVAGAKAKTRRRRVVDLSANAVAWLRAARREMTNDECRMTNAEASICGVWFDEQWRRFRRDCGFAVMCAKGEPWPHNALRHTYASMHYAVHENEARLQAQMGHESAAMLHRHYRALKTKAEARKFWELRPPVKGRNGQKGRKG